MAVLRARLGRDNIGETAATALGKIGPAAVAAAKDLRRYADVPGAAWAHWRVTGDPQVALDVLVAGLADRPRHAAIRELGDLGPPAAAATDRLRELSGTGEDWVRTEAAYALYRVTEDPDTAVSVLTEIARPLEQGTCLPVMITALEHLAAMGASAPSIARAVLDSPRRLGYFGGWRVFAEDERLRAAAARL